MDKLKQWIILTVVAVLVVGAGGWFLVISPKRSEAATVRSQVADQDSANGVLRTQLAMLKSQAKDLPRQQAKLAQVTAKIPSDPALPALIRALDKAATASNVELVSLSPGPATAVTATATTTAPVTPARPAATGAGAGTLMAIPLTLNVSGGYFQVEQFLDSVENLTRALKVTAFTLAPGGNPVKPSAAGAVDSGGNLNAAITSTVYMASGRTSVPSAVPAK